MFVLCVCLCLLFVVDHGVQLVGMRMQYREIPRGKWTQTHAMRKRRRRRRILMKMSLNMWKRQRLLPMMLTCLTSVLGPPQLVDHPVTQALTLGACHNQNHTHLLLHSTMIRLATASPLCQHMQTMSMLTLLFLLLISTFHHLPHNNTKNNQQ